MSLPNFFSLFHISFQSWFDHRLRWNKSDFGGTEWLISDVKKVWIPDLALINSDDVYALTRDTRFWIRIHSSGELLYVPTGRINARCEMDLILFPCK